MSSDQSQPKQLNVVRAYKSARPHDIELSYATGFRLPAEKQADDSNDLVDEGILKSLLTNVVSANVEPWDHKPHFVASFADCDGTLTCTIKPSDTQTVRLPANMTARQLLSAVVADTLTDLRTLAEMDHERLVWYRFEGSLHNGRTCKYVRCSCSWRPSMHMFANFFQSPFGIQPAAEGADLDGNEKLRRVIDVARTAVFQRYNEPLSTNFDTTWINPDETLMPNGYAWHLATTGNEADHNLINSLIHFVSLIESCLEARPGFDVQIDPAFDQLETDPEFTPAKLFDGDYNLWVRQMVDEARKMRNMYASTIPYFESECRRKRISATVCWADVPFMCCGHVVRIDDEDK